MMMMYRYASSTISAGVRSSARRGRAERMLTAMSETVMPVLMMTVAAKLLRMLCSSPAPNRWEVTIAAPWVKPIINPRIRKLRLPVLPTAARAASPMVRPTIKVSAIL